MPGEPIIPQSPTRKVGNTTYVSVPGPVPVIAAHPHTQRFAAAWAKWRELNESLQLIKDIPAENRNDWANNFVSERSCELDAIAALLNEHSDAGLVMFDAWLAARKRHTDTLLELAQANDNLRLYRDWMAWRTNYRVAKETEWLDHRYIEAMNAKMQKFIRYRYWTFNDEKYPDEPGYVADEYEGE